MAQCDRIIPSAGTETSADFFTARARVDVFKCRNFTYNLQVYKACKINYVKYHIECFATAYSPQYTNKIEDIRVPYTLSTNFGVNGFQGKIPFYIMWNNNCDITFKTLPEFIMDSMHARKLYIGGKGVTFIYSVPKNFRRFIDCTYLASVDPLAMGTNNLYAYLKRLGLSDMAPSFFFGTIGKYFHDMVKVLSSPEMESPPVKFFFKVTTTAGCTWKGKNDIVMSVNTTATYAAGGGELKAVADDDDGIHG